MRNEDFLISALIVVGLLYSLGFLTEFKYKSLLLLLLPPNVNHMQRILSKVCNLPCWNKGFLFFLDEKSGLNSEVFDTEQLIRVNSNTDLHCCWWVFFCWWFFPKCRLYPKAEDSLTSEGTRILHEFLEKQFVHFVFVSLLTTQFWQGAKWEPRECRHGRAVFDKAIRRCSHNLVWPSHLTILMKSSSSFFLWGSRPCTCSTARI